MFRTPIAVALATALIALCPTLPRADTPILASGSEMQQAGGLPGIVAALEGWLDTATDLPRRADAPRVRLVSAWQAAARQGATASHQRGRLRGLYDPERSEILLVRPWDPRAAEDVSVLLHELMHHRQAPHHWYCPAAQEPDAYRVQAAWLAERGIALAVNRVALVLDAGCTPRDIHPD